MSKQLKSALRRIAVGYYPSIAKAIGPARQFVGV